MVATGFTLKGIKSKQRYRRILDRAKYIQSKFGLPWEEAKVMSADFEVKCDEFYAELRRGQKT